MSEVRLALQVVALLATAIGLLVFAGFGPAFLLRDRRLRPYMPFFTPVVGLGVLLVVGHAIAWLPVGTDALAFPVLGLLGALNVVAWMRGARPTCSRSCLLLLIPGAVALVLAVLPIFSVGHLTTIGPEVDSIEYLSRAETIQRMGLLRAPEPSRGDPIGLLSGSLLSIGFRQGDQFLLAFLSSVTGLRPHLLFPILMALWYGLTSVGVALLARHFVRLSRGAALAAGLLVAIQPLLHWVTIDNFFSQAAGTAVAPWAVAAISLAFESRSRRAAILAGLLVATLASLYQAYLPYVFVIGVFPQVRLFVREGPPRDLLKRALELGRSTAWLGTTALVSMPAAWVLTVRSIRFFRSAVGAGGAAPAAPGNTTEFPHFGEVVGVINHCQATYHIALRQTPEMLATTVVLIAMTLAAYSLFRSARRNRWSAAGVFLVLGAGLWQQRFLLDGGNGYPYGYFKVVTLACPFVVLMVASGSSRFWRDSTGSSIPRMTARVALFCSWSLLVLPGLFHLSATAIKWSRGWTIATRERLGVEEAGRLVPRDEPLLVLDDSVCGRGWALYLIRHSRICDYEKYDFFHAPRQVESDRAPQYALILKTASRAVTDSAEPWISRSSGEVLWENGLYELIRRRDGVFAELPFARDGVPVTLDAASRVALDGEHVTFRWGPEPAKSFSQLFQHPPSRLDIRLSASTATRMTWIASGRAGSAELVPGTNTISLPVGVGSQELVLGPAPGVTLETLRAIGTPAS